MFPKIGNRSVSIMIRKFVRDQTRIVLPCVSKTQGFCNNSGHANDGFSLDDRYSREEQDVILAKVNGSTFDELKRYQITEPRLKKITAYRDKNGSFKSVEEILLLQGMETSVLDKFCKSIVKNKPARKPKTLNVRGELLTPVLKEEMSSESRTYMGIWIWGNLISWAQMSSDLNLLHWQCESLNDAIMKEGLIAVIEAVAKIVSKIPQSDVYIMESDPVIPFSRLNGATYSLHLQKQQITSAVVSILGMRENRTSGTTGIDDSETLINKVYMMRPRTPARLYDLLIGSEIVSAKAIVEKLINVRGGCGNDNSVNVYVETDLKDYYRRLDIFQREQMNWALLLTKAFLDLYILKISRVNNITKDRQSKRT